MEIINNPHDKLFKETLSDIVVVKDFIINYIPEEIFSQIDLNDIAIVKDSFVEKELRETFSDILYKVAINKQDAFIYILFEHKSYPYRLISIQFLSILLIYGN